MFRVRQHTQVRCLNHLSFSSGINFACPKRRMPFYDKVQLTQIRMFLFYFFKPVVTWPSDHHASLARRRDLGSNSGGYEKIIIMIFRLYGYVRGQLRLVRTKEELPSK